MLHVRVISPPGATGGLLGSLDASDAVINVTVAIGAGRHPAGDLVSFDLFTDGANPVLTRLRELGLDREGPITLERVDAAMIDPLVDALRREANDRETAPVWEVVEARIVTSATYPFSFYILMAIAGLIAAVGIITNSQILVVGAMVVGPEYAAILGIALGVNRHDHGAVRRGALALIVGFSLAVLFTFIFGLIMNATVHVPEAFRLGVRPVSDLIDTPNVYSIVVAIAAGIVGVVSTTEDRANTLIGVFVSVTTIPAAADVGVSLAFDAHAKAWGSFEQLILNVVLLLVVGIVGLRFQRAVWRAGSPRAWRQRLLGNRRLPGVGD